MAHLPIPLSIGDDWWSWWRVHERRDGGELRSHPTDPPPTPSSWGRCSDSPPADTTVASLVPRLDRTSTLGHPTQVDAGPASGKTSPHQAPSRGGNVRWQRRRARDPRRTTWVVPPCGHARPNPDIDQSMVRERIRSAAAITSATDVRDDRRPAGDHSLGSTRPPGRNRLQTSSTSTNQARSPSAVSGLGHHASIPVPMAGKVTWITIRCSSTLARRQAPGSEPVEQEPEWLAPCRT